MIAFVLHAHLPWLRGPDDAIGLEEEWFFEALWECYLPLLSVLESLAESKPARPLLTLSISPTLLAMLRDPALVPRFERYASDLEHALERDVPWLKPLRRAALDHTQRLAAARATLVRIRGDITGTLVKLEDSGVVELATTAATHALLPSLLTPETVRGQIRMGMRYFQAVTKRLPGTFWLPECGYDERLASLIGDSGIHSTVLASHGVELARPRPPTGVWVPIVGEGPIAYFGRSDELVDLVWSAQTGYPSNADYRDFYATVPDGPTAFKPFRVSGGRPIRAGDVKPPYEPEAAERRVVADVHHFMTTARALASFSPTPDPILVVAFDAELFGHWWWEGPRFLRGVLEELAREGLATSLGAYLERDPVLPLARPATSTWGRGGYAEVWTHPATGHASRIVHRAERRILAVDALVRDTPRTETQRDARLWAIRELFLLEASDYAFMLRTGQCAAFAEKKIHEHAQAVDRLSEIAERPVERPEDRAFVDKWIARRPLFAELDEDAWSDAFDPW